MRRKKHLPDRLARCAAVAVGDPKALRESWRSLMPSARSLCLEIGCGKGRFVNDMAEQSPDTLFIAVEREAAALVMAMEKTMARGLSNVFYISADAALLPECFAPGEVDAIYINFCDPWPSNKHAKRRLTHRNFLGVYSRIIRPGGMLYFKTDNAPLFAFSLLEMERFGLRLSGVTHDLHGPSGAGIPNVMTEYEERFSSQGVPICRLAACFPDPLPAESAGDTPHTEGRA